MKKILFAISLLICLGACTEVMDLPSDGFGDLLIVNGSLCSADSLHTLSLHVSSREKGIISPGEVRGKLYVNGTLRNDTLSYKGTKEDTTLCLLTFKAQFAPEDELKLVFESSVGICEVNESVPPLPVVAGASTGEDIVLSYSDYGNQETRSFHRFYLGVADAAGVDNAFRVSAYLDGETECVEGIKDPRYYSDQTGVKKSYDDEPVKLYNLLEPVLKLPWMSSESVNDFNIFSDESFAGGEYTLTLCWFGSLYHTPSLAGYYEGDTHKSEVWVSRAGVNVRLESIPVGYYRYLMAAEYDVTGAYLPLVYEPSFFPSNVEGGLGYVNVSSALEYRIPYPDRYYDSDHYYEGYVK